MCYSSWMTPKPLPTPLEIDINIDIKSFVNIKK